MRPRSPTDLGVFVYLPPTLRGHELQAQGLARLALTTAAALAKHRGGNVVLVVPAWAAENVRSVVNELAGDSIESISVLSPARPSCSELLARIVIWRRDARSHQRPYRSLLGRGRCLRETACARAVVRHRLATVLSISLVAGFLLFWNATGPLFVLTAIGFLICAGLAGIALVIGPPIFSLVRFRGRSSIAFHRTRSSVWQYLLRGATLAIERADVRHLVRFANTFGVNRWLLPVALYSQTSRLRGARISIFADYSPAEFPALFSDDLAIAGRGCEMAIGLGRSDIIVCLSEHVRDRHLPVLLPSSMKDTIVIPPGQPHRMALEGRLLEPDAKLCALRVGRRYPASPAAELSWWLSPVIISPTQDRPYKNLRTLISALRILNEGSAVRVHLALTCNPSTSGLGELVRDWGLGGEVAFLTDIPDSDLEVAIRTASVAVTPSLFEGSLPFTLYEAVSNGTPCVMADIPVTREAFRGVPEMCATTLFSPTDAGELAERIRFALRNRDRLVVMQRDFVRDYYEANNWDLVADRYWAAVDNIDVAHS